MTMLTCWVRVVKTPQTHFSRHVHRPIFSRFSCQALPFPSISISISISSDLAHLPSKLSAAVFGAFLAGWRCRVLADPQFPFKVVMEELVGVSACVLGDMATRPNLGLNELDFVFSTLVVASILNFVVMYVLAPTASASPPVLFSAMSLVRKGLLFSAVGFAAGLVGTALSNGLSKNKAPPTVLNAMTWAAHMGLSSNLRYHTLNGIEFLLEPTLSPPAFKVSVLVLRLLNNVLGGITFVLLARFTGAQKDSPNSVN